MPGPKLTSASELLFRHVSPSFMRDGRPSSQAFFPTKKDDGQLSVNRASLTTAAAAFTLFTTPPPSGLGLRCEGTWAVSVAECANESLDVLEDPMTAPPEPVANPAHAVVDFRGCSRGQCEKRGMKLLQAAMARARQHPPAEARVPLDETG